MKASELVSLIQEAIKEYGDLDITMLDHERGTLHIEGISWGETFLELEPGDDYFGEDDE